MKGLVADRLTRARLVLVHRGFYKNKPLAARNKSFRIFKDVKAVTLKP